MGASFKTAVVTRTSRCNQLVYIGFGLQKLMGKVVVIVLQISNAF